MGGGAMISYLGSTLTSGAAGPQVVSLANPLPVQLSGGIGGLSVAGTEADATAVGGQFPVVVGGVDYASGLIHRLNTDLNGVLNVNVLTGGGSAIVQQGAGNTANPWTVQGPVAGGVATSGNPLKAGAVFNTTQPTYLTGQTAELQVDTHGGLLVDLFMAAVTGVDAAPNKVAFVNSQAAVGQSGLAVYPYRFNGATFDRDTKTRSTFRLPSSGASNNAGNAKASPGTVYSISGQVALAASTCYLKLFDTTVAPNPAALVPLYFFPLVFSGDPVFSFYLPPGGLYFPTGIGVAIVANIADLDNTAIAAGQIVALLMAFL
jgi:hypothetical protein